MKQSLKFVPPVHQPTMAKSFIPGSKQKSKQNDAKKSRRKTGKLMNRTKPSSSTPSVRKLSLRDCVSMHAGNATSNYLDYVDGKPMSGSELHPPSKESAMVTKWSTTARYTVTTGPYGTATALLNPLYLDQLLIVRAATTPGLQYGALSYGNGCLPGSALIPYTTANSSNLHTLVTPVTGLHQASLENGNNSGLRRVVGIEIDVIPLGTQYSSGGYVAACHNRNMGAMAGQYLSSVLASPYTIRKSLAANKPVRFQYGGHVCGLNLRNLKNFANQDDIADEVDHPALDVFGVGHQTYSENTCFGPDAPSGWTCFYHIQGAVPAQPYEVTVVVHYEGELVVPSNSHNTLLRTFLEKPNVLLRANPSGVSLVETASAIHSDITTTSAPSQIWKHVGEVLESVIPLAAGYAAKYIAGI